MTRVSARGTSETSGDPKRRSACGANPDIELTWPEGRLDPKRILDRAVKRPARRTGFVLVCLL